MSSTRDRCWGGIFDDLFCSTLPMHIYYVRGQPMQVIESYERRYHIVEPVGQVLPPQKQHGPQRKGRGGKIKRW